MTYVFLLLVNMANLEPDVFFGQRARGIANNVFEALEWISHSSQGPHQEISHTSKLWLNFCCCLYMIPRRK
jgi:hypothetical protein